jgi:hypothetical protein
LDLSFFLRSKRWCVGDLMALVASSARCLKLGSCVVGHESRGWPARTAYEFESSPRPIDQRVLVVVCARRGNTKDGGKTTLDLHSSVAKLRAGTRVSRGSTQPTTVQEHKNASKESKLHHERIHGTAGSPGADRSKHKAEGFFAQRARPWTPLHRLQESRRNP